MVQTVRTRACIVLCALVAGACRGERASLPPGASAGGGAPVAAGPPLDRAPLGQLDLRVTLETAGVVVRARGRVLDASCTRAAPTAAEVTIPARPDGAVDAARVAHCARAVARSLAAPGETQVTVTARHQTPHRDLSSTLEAIVGDDRGGPFPDLSLLPPVDRQPPKLAADASWTPATGKFDPDDALVVVVTKVQIVLAGKRVVEFDGFERAELSELPAAFARQKRSPEVVVVADESAPYGLIFQVLLASSHAGASRFQLQTLQRAP